MENAGQGKFEENLPAHLPNPQSGTDCAFQLPEPCFCLSLKPQHRSFLFLINGKLVFLGSKGANPFGNPLPAPFTRFI